MEACVPNLFPANREDERGYSFIGIKFNIYIIYTQP